MTTAIDHAAEEEPAPDVGRPSLSLVNDTQPSRGTLLLDELVRCYDRHVLMPNRHATNAAALFAASTWFRRADNTQAGNYAVRMLFFSWEHNSGKSTAGKLTTRLCYRPKIGGDMSDWAVVRSIAEHNRTVCLDNLDTKISGSKGLPPLLLNILEPGFDRETAYVDRGKGDGEDWPVFAPIVVTARAGKLMRHPELNPGVTERGIIVWMQAAPDGVDIEPFDVEDPDHAADLAALRTSLELWASEHVAAWEADRKPPLPPGCPNVSRLADVWRPIFRTARIAGGPWLARAWAAFRALVFGETADPETKARDPLAFLAPAERTLVEVRAAFAAAEEDMADESYQGRLSTADLIGILADLPGTAAHWSNDESRRKSQEKRISNALGAVAEAHGLELDRESTKVPAGDGRYPSGYWWREVERITPSGLPVFPSSGAVPPPDATPDTAA